MAEGYKIKGPMEFSSAVEMQKLSREAQEFFAKIFARGRAGVH
jgi:hypothetical protein